MDKVTLDANLHLDLILLLYTETLPYTGHRPPGITIDALEKICKAEGVVISWRRTFWTRDQLSVNRILINHKNEDKDVKFFTRYLRNSFAHCQISISNGMVYAYCKDKNDNGEYKGWKVFEMFVQEKALIQILKFIKTHKR